MRLSTFSVDKPCQGQNIVVETHFLKFATLFSAGDLLAFGSLVLIGLLHRWISQWGKFFLVVSNLPISLAHELAHYLTALALGGQPSGFTIWPEIDKDKRWVFGSISFRPTMLSALPTTLAPLLWLPVGGLLLLSRVELAQGSLEKLCLVYLVAYVCIAASIPSFMDIKVAVTNPMSVMFWGGIYWGASTLLG